MELAVNTFSKGLQLDTHPMVLGTDVLSDCLNGTLLTMNGNEVVLLNDMGNRRVNNAFLPSGYLPVGMKEYGGIIYVAAYNPITNKSLIGSFPSPQRKIGEVFEGENALPATFDFNNFFNDYNIEEDDYLHIDILKSDSFLVPLTGNYNLRAGDKFTIYSPDLYGDGENYEKFLYLYITNYKNTANGKIKSPKNKRYTLSVGILNSLNEFVDITKTLCRWDDNSNIIPYDSSYSDLYKFNDGYFISKEFSNDVFSEPIDDSQLIKTRLKIATNTYAYKLVGPLYLKITLNHILDFNYNLEILKIEDSQSNSEEKIATLRIDGYITYNCPDGVFEISPDFIDDTYITFEEGNPDLNAFDFLDENTLTILSPTNTIIGNSVYNKVSNTYSVLITKFYNVKYTESNSTLNYIIGVNADKDISNLYLKNLSHKGLINFELFGSGKIILSKWLFKNEDAFTNLTLLLETYPKLGEIFDNLKLIFTDISTINTNEVKTITVDSIKISNSPITLSLNWQFYKFEPLKIYLVDIKYDKYKDGEIVESDIVLDDIKGSIICKSILFKTEESSLSNTESEEILVTNNDFRWKADYIDGDTIKSVKVDGDETHMGKLLIEELASYILPLAENFLYNNPNYILKNLVIGSKTKLMGNISGSMELESVEILPGGLTSLPGYAFSECTKLKSVILPEGLTTINGSCFHYCTSLETLFLPKSIEDFSALNVLEGCTSLKTLFLGPNINKIGYWFTNGPTPETLTDIYCYNVNPPEIPNNIPRVGRLCISRKDITTWHFPIEALEAYENWVEEGDARGLLYKEFVFDITEEEILMYGENILKLETYNNEELEEEIILELPEEKIKLKKTNVSTRWLITTELFNEFYDSNIIQDFCTTDNLDFLNKMNIPLNLSVSNVNKTIEHKDSFYEGNLLSDTPSSVISFKQKNSCIISCNEKLKISSLDLSLYPIILPDIQLKYKGNYNVYLNNTLLDENNTPNEVFKRYSHFVGNYDPENPSLFDFNIGFNLDKTEFIGNINWYDICFGKSSSLPTTISNCFDSLSTVFNHFGPGNHARVYYNVESLLENKRVYRIEDSSGVYLTGGTFSNIEDLSSIFNTNLEEGLVFSYSHSSFPDESGENLIWWKVGDSSLWTCISNNIYLYGPDVSSNIKNIILDYFGGDLIYCIYKDKDFYVIDGNYIYSDTYNINMKISIPIVLKTSTYIDFWNIGNLNFNSENLYISPLSINIPITLNENFKDLILLTVMNKSYKNIEVNSGILLDINKKTLQPNTVYYKNNNNLIPIYLSKYFTIDDESEINSIKLNTFGLYDYYIILNPDLSRSRSYAVTMKLPKIGTHLVTNLTLHPRGSVQTSNPRSNT